MIPLRDDIRSRRQPVMTWSLLAACAVVWLLQFSSAGGSTRAFNQILLTYGMVPANVLSGVRLWTLLSSVFMHGSWMHFLGNMLYLWIFGDNVEDALGPFWYLLMYLGSGLFGNLLHIGVAVAVGDVLSVPTIGASGAISGVMGAYFVLYPRARVLTIIPFFIFIRMVYLPAGVLLGFWILFQVLNGCGAATVGGAGIAYFAHIGGFVVGLLVGIIARRRSRDGIWYDIH